MSAFEKHGMSALSASTINGWIDQPALTLLKIAGITDGQAGPAAWRGTASEHAMNVASERAEPYDMEQLIGIAQERFDEIHKKAEEEHDPLKIEKERTHVADYVLNGVNYLKDFMGDVVDSPLTQGKVLFRLDELSVPVVGYYDMLFRSPNQIIDIKTSAARPKKPSYAHARQLAIYAHATGAEPWVWYVNRSGVSAFTIHNTDAYLRQFVAAAKTLENTLSQSDDIFECCQFVFPDVDHWKWGDTTRAAAKDIWKMEI